MADESNKDINKYIVHANSNINIASLPKVNEPKKEEKVNKTDAQKKEEKQGKNTWLQYAVDKYKNVHKLNASQEDPADRHYVNFRQDYVLVIRKKPFYAATRQQRYTGDKADYGVDTKGQKYLKNPLMDNSNRIIMPEDNYLRAYQVNNFINISITTSVHNPGTASVTIKGAERVICAENFNQENFGFFGWSDLVGSWLDINEAGAYGDGTGVESTTGDINIKKLNNSIDAVITTGDININNMQLTENSSIRTTTGDIYIKTNNEFYVDASSSTGDINIKNNYRTSEYELKLKSTTGDIKVEN